MPFGNYIGDSEIRKQDAVDQLRKERRIVKHTDPDAATKRVRTRLEKSLTAWIKHHGGEAFDRPFSADHGKVIAKIETAINKGGMFALAMPRGSGKSTILKWAMLYCLLTGRRRYIVVVAATGELAQILVEFARQQIQESDTLHAHYPHVCEYARKTDGKAIKAKYQLRGDGKSSGIHWSKTTLVLPEVVDGKGVAYPSNGGILEGHGLTGAIRGKWRDTKTGKVLRPDFVLIDDPQTRESAESESQCRMRERIITGDVLGLAGPRKKIAAVMPCTIVRKDDLAARFLDAKQHPEWRGETCHLVDEWPTEQDGLWTDYGGIYRDQGIDQATEFYRAHREDMDAGARVTWDHRVRDGELSALQTAENLLIETGEQFWAEYQNDPVDPIEQSQPYVLTPQIITARTTKRKPYDIPEWATRVFASSDINPSYALSTIVIGFGEDQTAAILWYGLHKLTIPVTDMPAAQYARALYPELVAHGRALSGMPCKPEAWAMDAGGAQFDAIAPYSTQISDAIGLPAMAFTGRGWRAYKETAQTVVKSTIREQVHGAQAVKAGMRLRWHPWNADYWGEKAQRAWLGPDGAPGSITLPSGAHTEFAQQVCNQRLRGMGVVGDRMVWDFVKLPGKNDFHDAVAQCYALAAYHGIGTGGQTESRPARKKYSNADLRR